jgi:hypothetical protein
MLVKTLVTEQSLLHLLFECHGLDYKDDNNTMMVIMVVMMMMMMMMIMMTMTMMLMIIITLKIQGPV